MNGISRNSNVYRFLKTNYIMNFLKIRQSEVWTFSLNNSLSYVLVEA